MGQLVKLNKEDSEVTDMMSEGFKELMDFALDKIKPMIKPATRRITDFMNTGKMILIKPIDGMVHVFLLEEEDVEDFSMKEGKVPLKTFSMEEFVSTILSGNIQNMKFD